MIHQTASVEVSGKLIEVDCGIVSVVRWLNDFDPGVETTYSCEGHEEDEGEYETYETRQPYVSFKCDKVGTLERIMQAMEEPRRLVVYCRCEANCNPAGELSFVLRFSTKNRMRDFIRDKLC